MCYEIWGLCHIRITGNGTGVAVSRCIWKTAASLSYCCWLKIISWAHILQLLLQQNHVVGFLIISEPISILDFSNLVLELPRQYVKLEWLLWQSHETCCLSFCQGGSHRLWTGKLQQSKMAPITSLALRYWVLPKEIVPSSEHTIHVRHPLRKYKRQ